MELDSRKKTILSGVIECYIETGEPVGSAAVVRLMKNAVSSATIRNEMASLEKLGLLEQPHTSAGRIPTELGYRYYVDHLMKKRKLTQKEQAQIDKAFQLSATDPENLIEAFSKEIAEFTKLASVSTFPIVAKAMLQQIHVIQVQKFSLFAVLVTNFGVVKKKAMKTDFELASEDLVVLNNFLNQNFCHILIEQLTPAALQTMLIGLGEYAFTLTPVVFSIYRLAQEVIESSVYIEGQNNLLGYENVNGNIKNIFDFLQSRQQIMRMITSNRADTGVLIGGETNFDGLRGTSVVLTKYKIGDIPIGTIGIIGPERMDYSKIIPHVEYFASVLERFLNEYFE